MYLRSQNRESQLFNYHYERNTKKTEQDIWSPNMVLQNYAYKQRS